MRKYLFLLLGITMVDVSFGQTTANISPQKSSLYETSSELLMTDMQLRSTAGFVTFSKGSLLGDSVFPAIKTEWEKSLNSSFSQKEIKYLNDMFSSSLLKRFYQFQRNFSNPANIKKLIDDKLKAKEIGMKAPAPQGK